MIADLVAGTIASLVKVGIEAAQNAALSEADAIGKLRAALASEVARLDAHMAALDEARAKADAEIAGAT